MQTSDRLGGIPHTCTVEDLARLLQCSTRTVRRLMAEGRFPFPTLPLGGRLVRFSGAHVSQFMAGETGVSRSQLMARRTLRRAA
jgi:excisionase family DNA binding protein